MSIDVQIVDGPVTNGPMSRCDGPDGAGAVLIFDGVVRGIEDGRRIQALDYEAYEPMAPRQFDALAKDIAAKHRLISLSCHHSRGRVGVGECSMRVRIRSAHRSEALAAMGEFIERLKKDVPIWKTPVWAE